MMDAYEKDGAQSSEGTLVVCENIPRSVSSQHQSLVATADGLGEPRYCLYEVNIDFS